jgi:hypothetical protein
VILAAGDVIKRAAKIRALLRPISRVSSGPATENIQSGGLWIIGTRDETTVASNYRDWRFATSADKHHAMYFEAWRVVDKRRYKWQSAYLNIYRRTAGQGEEEVICLHCDPAEAIHAPHARYKRGPHLHFSSAGDPLKHAHIALHMGRVDDIVQRCESIHNHLALGVEMIRDEVLSLLGVSDPAS